jgi:predicted RNA-binding Zn ribbon-like protein
MDDYAGPARDEPLAVELHNTLYAVRGNGYDGLADNAGADAWLAAMSHRLPAEARGASVPGARLRDLRDAVRAALHAAADGTPLPGGALRALNAAVSAAPRALEGRLGDGGAVVLAERHPGAGADQIVLAELARSALELVGELDPAELRACGAPGCVLMFVKDHRREWCSVACGNRARQSRLSQRRAAPP